jgi:D-3-phosphoglycerate dehydrogenase
VPLTIVIDFDSTLVEVEALDELARIALREAPDQGKRLEEIQRLTDDGMNGTIGFGESLSKRLQLFQATRKQVAEVVQTLRGRVTPSFREQAAELRRRCKHLYVVSGGFSEYIVPVVREFGIEADHVLANTFRFDEAGRIIGCDRNNPLARDGGKITVLRNLDLTGQVIMVGDGFSDLQVAKAGVASAFVAFTGNVTRPGVVREADYTAADFGEVLQLISNYEKAAT